MTTPTIDHAPTTRLAAARRGRQAPSIRPWLALLPLAALAALLASALTLPAAWLVGPLIAALVLTITRGLMLTMPRPLDAAAQATIGIVVSQSFAPSALAGLGDTWLPVAICTLGTLILSVLLGLLLARLGGIDSSTATIGTIPGAAPSMVAISASLGADPRMVAVMQYLRVIVVVLSASLLAHALFPPGIVHGVPTATSLPQHGHHLADYPLTIALAAGAIWLALRLRMPAGTLVGPMLLAIALSGAGLFQPILLPGMAPTAYLLLGIRVGLLFDLPALRHIGRLLPAILAFVVGLMLGCGALAWLLTALAGIDRLTAYLATTPGGVDSITVMAVGSGANMSIVVAVQMARLLTIMLIGPPLVRWLVRRATPMHP